MRRIKHVLLFPDLHSFGNNTVSIYYERHFMQQFEKIRILRKKNSLYMRRNIMKSRMYWGVAILILLLVTAAVFIIVNKVAEDRELEVQLKEAEKMANWIKQQEVLKDRPSAAEALEKTETETGAGTETEINLEEMTESYLKTLSKEELQQIMDSFYTRFGLPPPPRGYQYKWTDIDVPLLDENGKPVLDKIGDPYVNIAIEIGFAPTKEEYEKLNQLKDDLFQAERSGWDDKVVSLTQEIETLEALVQRERPILKGTMWIGKSGTHDRERTRRMAREQLDEALRSYNLEHLIGTDSYY